MFNKIAMLLCLLTALQACTDESPGSGGGIGGSGIAPIEAFGATLGSISGFGSIIVNGQRYDTDNATFMVNEQPIAQSDLRVGMSVLAAVDFSSNTASEVTYVPSLIGPVESVDLVDKRFVSLGQTIQLGGGTTFENLSLAQIAPGMVVEVSALRNATGVMFANFIRVAPDPTRYQLTGAILSNLGDSQQFLLNGLPVDIAQADLSQVSAAELEFGDKVYVTAAATAYDPAAPLLTVDSVRVALEPMVVEGERIEYEGIVSSFTSPFEFDVYWQPVTTSDQTQVEFQDGSVAALSMIMLNTRLEIEGVVQADGSYHASRVILIATENSKISGVIDSIEPAASTFSLLGLDVQVTDRTRFEGSPGDSSDQEVASFSGLSAGHYVEVDAAFLGNRLIANSVEVDDVDERAILEGPVTALDTESGQLDIINRPIVFDAQTSFETSDDVEISREQFIEQLQPGVVVKARWDEFQSIVLPVDSLEIE